MDGRPGEEVSGAAGAENEYRSDNGQREGAYATCEEYEGCDQCESYESHCAGAAAVERSELMDEMMARGSLRSPQLDVLTSDC